MISYIRQNISIAGWESAYLHEETSSCFLCFKEEDYDFTLQFRGKDKLREFAEFILELTGELQTYECECGNVIQLTHRNQLRAHGWRALTRIDNGTRKPVYMCRQCLERQEHEAKLKQQEYLAWRDRHVAKRGSIEDTSFGD